ncbi:MAG: chemotaxis protein CheB [Gemmataceae bacterium]
MRQCGGHIIAQDEKSSVIYGMPGATVAAGLAQHTLPLDQIAAQILKYLEPG